MSIRKVVDEKDARACLAAVARSGEALRTWARRYGIDGRSLRAWQMNLSARGSTRAPARPATAKLVELVPVPTASPARRYVVRVGDAAVEVSDDFDAATLRRILEVLRAW